MFESRTETVYTPIVEKYELVTGNSISVTSTVNSFLDKGFNLCGLTDVNPVTGDYYQMMVKYKEEEPEDD